MQEAQPKSAAEKKRLERMAELHEQAEAAAADQATEEGTPFFNRNHHFSGVILHSVCIFNRDEGEWRWGGRGENSSF